MSILEKCAAVYRKNYPYFIIFILCCVAFVAFFWNNIVVTVHSGERGVKYNRFSGGTVLSHAYGEGLYLLWPFDIMFIYNTRVIKFSEETLMPTKNGMFVKVRFSCQFQVDINRLPQLHQQIGPNYQKNIVIPMTQSVVRQVIGRYSAEDLYSKARKELEDDMMVRAVTSLGRLPITVHGFLVENLSFPKEYNKAIVNKMIEMQKFERYKYTNEIEVAEAKRKFIEGFGIKKFQELINTGMTENFLRFEGIRATKKLASSINAKLVVVGGGKDGLPVILNSGDMQSTASQNSLQATNDSLPSTQAQPSEAEKESASPSISVQVTQDEQKSFADYLKELEAILTHKIILPKPKENSE